jgi:hypothetical protein
MVILEEFYFFTLIILQFDKMARELIFQVNASQFSFSPTKIDRSKIYGWTEIKAMDSKNVECKTFYMDRSGSIMIPKGGVSYGIIDSNGKWVNKNELLAVNPDGTPAQIIPSSFSASIVLDKTVSAEEFLDHAINAAYELSGEPAELIKLMDGKIFTFIYNYRDDYEGDNAFVLEAKDKLYLLVGKKLDFEFVGIEQTSIVSEEEPEELSEEIDFSMM